MTHLGTVRVGPRTCRTAWDHAVRASSEGMPTPFGGSVQSPLKPPGWDVTCIASDLNPIACMLTWGSFNIVGADPISYAEMKNDQERVVADIDSEISAMGIEHDGKGNRGKAYLYCLETRCPRTGYMVPLLPTRVLSSRRFDAIVELTPDHENRRYDISVRFGVSKEELSAASDGTVQSGRLYHEVLEDPLGVSIKEIRGDFKDEAGVGRNRLRRWTKEDFSPREDDIFQERLYAIQWINGEDIKKGKSNPRHGLPPDPGLSRFSAAPSARLSHFPFESDRAFPAER